MSKRLEPCPFCGGNVYATHGMIGAELVFIKCKKCGAVMSFDNAECNSDPIKAIDYFNRRTIVEYIDQRRTKPEE
mgnify:FL=1